MKYYYKDFSSGATASIEVHKNGTATLRIFCGYKRTSKKYSSKKSAYNAWYRFTA